MSHPLHGFVNGWTDGLVTRVRVARVRVARVRRRDPQAFRKFRRIHGYRLDLANPRTFNEKLMWLRYFGGLERFAPFADKYAVRTFVEERCGGGVLVPLVGVYDRASDIDVRTLPVSCVIKATHGCKWNVIVEDRSRLDWEATVRRLDGWLATNYCDVTGEPNYRPLVGRIVVEERLVDPSGDLKDYKFFCRGGEPVYVQVDGDRLVAHKRDMHTLDWAKLPMTLRHPNLPEPMPRPARLEEMVEVARRLSRGFPFVRVDLYHVDGRVLFGEMSFTPGNGNLAFRPVAWDLVFGDLIDLEGYARLTVPAFGRAPAGDRSRGGASPPGTD